MECEKCNNNGVYWNGNEYNDCRCDFGLALKKLRLAIEKSYSVKLTPIKSKKSKLPIDITLDLNIIDELIDLSLSIENLDLFMHYTNMKMEMTK